MEIRVRKRLIQAKLASTYNLQNYAKVKDFNFLSIKAYSEKNQTVSHLCICAVRY